MVASPKGQGEIPDPMRTVVLLGVLASWRLATVSLAAQDASAYVPLHYWGMPYVEHLIARGAMADPAPLTRPLRQAALVTALRAVDTVALSGGERRIVGRMLADLTRREQGPWGRVDGHVTAGAGSHARRDPLRPAGPGHATIAGGLAVQLAFGPIVAVSHPYFDTRLKYDPDWYGKKDRVIAGRLAEAYVSAQWRYGEVFFGSLDRNWGPSDVPGILLSDSPYGLDHLGIVLGTSGVQLQAVATQLDDLPDSTGALHHRHYVSHRLWLRPPGRWTVALWETSVTSGVGRELEPWYLNLMGLGFLAQVNTRTNVNSFVGLDVQRRGRVTLYGQFMLDDIQIDRKKATDRKPTSYAFTVGARGPGLLQRLGWRVYYTQVSNLAFRNEDDLQVPLYFGLGTGRNFSDYHQLTARASVVAFSLLVEPEMTLLRQGEGDPRLPHPSVSEYDVTPTFLAGVVERTVRFALSARLEAGPLSLAGDGGVHVVRNAAHVPGAERTRWVGSVGVTYRFRRESLLP